MNELTEKQKEAYEKVTKLMAKENISANQAIKKLNIYANHWYQARRKLGLNAKPLDQVPRKKKMQTIIPIQDEKLMLVMGSKDQILSFIRGM